MEEWRRHLEDPVVLAAAGGALLLLVVLVVVRLRRPKPKGQVFDDTLGRARMKLRSDMRAFRDDLNRLVAQCGPVFRKVETTTGVPDPVGHVRRESSHRIQVRAPDLGTLKQMARTLGYDSTPVSQLEAHWRKVERQLLEYNSGKLDDSRTPIAAVKQLEKEMQSAIVLANLCITAYSK